MLHAVRALHSVLIIPDDKACRLQSAAAAHVPAHLNPINPATPLVVTWTGSDQVPATFQGHFRSSPET
jgi:hypothetical protein